MSLTERFVRAITFCLERDGHAGDLEALARWALSGRDGQPAPGDAALKVALVAGGATRIKAYVFESSRLPEIRGASGLLDRINRKDVVGLWAGPEPSGVGCAECVVYANGGEVLAFAPLTLAPRLADEIERLYTSETLVAQSVAVWRAFTLAQIRDGLLSGEDIDEAAVADLLGHNPASKRTFGSLVVPLALDKFRRREGNDYAHRAPRPVAHFETIPFARRCSSCERRAAVVNARVSQDENRPLCEPCARKRIYGQLTRREDADRRWWDGAGLTWEPDADGEATSWKAHFEDWLGEETEQRRRLKEKYAAGEGGKPPADFRAAKAVRDLDEIAQASEPQGFIGMIYADGNNVGELLENLTAPSDYASFAEHVDLATQNAVFASLAEHLRLKTIRRDQEVSVHPFEILSVGGDDLLLIVPAHVAVPIACTIAERAEEWLLSADANMFERRNEGGGSTTYHWPDVQRCAGTPPARQCKVTLSAGVVIAGAHTPVYYLEELAGQLLKSAKARAKRLRREHGYYGATIDFLSLKSITAISGTVEQFRAAALTTDDRRRFARPYTIAEMRTLWETIRLLKKKQFPRSQLHRLRESLRAGVAQANIDYLYFLSRDDKVRAARAEIERMWTPADGRPVPHPWRERLEKTGSWETIWFDIVELYDFVREEDSGDAPDQG